MDDIVSLSAFLKYGPTGLAGLMLVLVIIALREPKMPPARERILTRFMYVGAFCFTAALAANFFSVRGSYDLYFRVEPIQSGRLPLPIITINNTPIELKQAYLVKSQATAIIDVTDAINFTRKSFEQIVKQSDAIVGELSKVAPTIHNNCPGGSSGRSASNNPTVIEIVERARSSASSIKAAASSAIAPEVPIRR